MPQFEVEVRTVSSVYYLVEAKTADEAAKKWSLGIENGEFIESEEVIAVIPDDDRFVDGEDTLTDEYEIEQEETDE